MKKFFQFNAVQVISAFAFIIGLVWSAAQWRSSLDLAIQERKADVNSLRLEVAAQDAKMAAQIDKQQQQENSENKRIDILLDLYSKRLQSIEDQQKLDRDILIRLNSLEIKLGAIQSDVSDIKKKQALIQSLPTTKQTTQTSNYATD